MLAEMLKLKKINVVTEVDPDNVLNILKNKIFDLIFLDIQMPRTNGFTLVKSMLDSDIFQSKSTPVIALSAKSDLSSADLRQLGFTDFLNKPFTSAQLFTMINRYLKTKLAVEKGAIGDHKGISALIDVVKDDRESSLEILKTFVLDTGKTNNELKSCFEKNDMENAAQVAHKMLPLFKMMGDGELSDILLKLDYRKVVGEEEKSRVTEEIDRYIDEAKKRVSEMEKR
jgi:CheY-like chemotaxis protein